jgi:type I restriction enzyme S subunit
MQRLLSEGIGHSEFKESEIGRIPAGWDYQTFEEAKIQIIDGDRGTNYPKQHDFFQEGFCLFLSAKNVTKRGFEFFEKQFITEEKDSLLRKGKLVKFDIVLTTRGTVGNIAYFDSSVAFENMRINSGMVLIRVQENLDSKYLYKIMTSELIQKNIQNIAFGSAQPQLTVKEIKNFKIPIPPLEEQKEIAEILSTTDEKLETLRAKKEVFETLKKGLMRKLLSGEVRV